VRVLLIYPNIDCPIGVNHGLSIISGVLRAAGHETSLLHVNEKLFDVPTDEELVARVGAWDPGLVGFSVMSQQYGWAAHAADVLRAAFPDLPLVAGGVHCTMVPDEVVADGHFDVVAVGEAELAFGELVDALAAGQDPTGVRNMRFPAGTLFNPGSEPISNPVGPFPELADLPPNHYELFDMERIVRAKNGWFGVLTSRGCPYKCTYCFNREIVDRYAADGVLKAGKSYLRHYPVERMVGELNALTERYPDITTFLFDDDLFTLDKSYVREFCAAYKEVIDRPYVINAHVQVFDDEMAFMLRDSGCFMIKYGLESGSPRVRKDVLWRFMGNERIRDATRTMHRYGLHTSAFVMFGLPTETREEVMETLRLCAEVELGRFRWALFFPFPGTAGYRIAEERGLIDHERAADLGNYFDGTCLRFDPDMDLLLAKLGRVAHWWVNAFSSWPSAPIYQALVDEVESWDRAAWERNKRDLHRRDRELSEQLLARGVRHYSLRYTHVMGVDSDFVLAERARLEQVPEYVPVGYTLDD
jgi:radical SAM superfamily enzyme YgiQ (UPF0313 family)